ncbi:hypothetical protein BJ508DRAFT_364708 [Ascobolus immersus RN42]|uniref:Uncharacterized protein n=1 Tax=Ascobolus immersus RN42 TaxID=1160509 RepID=A0A3N4I576_ASCIM|nr:hypothetical protein BJ508DRAFT_364708 [Ascobolus immersus RN42]
MPKAPKAPAPPRWEGLTHPEIHLTLTTSYLPMLRTRLLLDYSDHLNSQSTLHHQHLDTDSISTAFPWTKALAALDTERKQTLLAKQGRLYIPPKQQSKKGTAKQQTLPIPIWKDLLDRAATAQESGTTQPEILEMEIRKYLNRLARRKEWSLDWLIEQGWWEELAVQLMWDHELIAVAFEDEDERCDMMEALKVVRVLYFKGVSLESWTWERLGWYWKTSRERWPVCEWELSSFAKTLKVKARGKDGWDWWVRRGRRKV